MAKIATLLFLLCLTISHTHCIYLNAFLKRTPIHYPRNGHHALEKGHLLQHMLEHPQNEGILGRRLVRPTFILEGSTGTMGRAWTAPLFSLTKFRSISFSPVFQVLHNWLEYYCVPYDEVFHRIVLLCSMKLFIRNIK